MHSGAYFYVQRETNRDFLDFGADFARVWTTGDDLYDI